MDEMTRSNQMTQNSRMMEENQRLSVGSRGVVVQRSFKDRLFRMIFNDRKELLGLYNAMNGTTYTNVEDMTICTLENAIYMSVKNDLSFLIDSRISLYEHQSSNNPNLPLRDLGYVADLYSTLTRESNLYGEKLIRIPTPQFVVFYNGVKEQPERKVLKLSDAYEIQDREVNLELKVLVLNINPGYNVELMKACRTLHDYMCYVDKVRTYAKEAPLEEAVERAISECIRNDILADFLRNYRAEAMSVSIYEYDEEKHMKQIFAEGKNEGIEQGIEALILDNMEENISSDRIIIKLQNRFRLNEEQAKAYFGKYGTKF